MRGNHWLADKRSVGSLAEELTESCTPKRYDNESDPYLSIYDLFKNK